MVLAYLAFWYRGAYPWSGLFPAFGRRSDLILAAVGLAVVFCVPMVIAASRYHRVFFGPNDISVWLIGKVIYTYFSSSILETDDACFVCVQNYYLYTTISVSALWLVCRRTQ